MVKKLVRKGLCGHDHRILKPFHVDAEWFLDSSMISPDVPVYGPYESEREARKARVDYLKSQKFRLTPLLAEGAKWQSNS